MTPAQTNSWLGRQIAETSRRPAGAAELRGVQPTIDEVARGSVDPDKTRILVIRRAIDDARLMVAGSGALHIVWGDPTIDSWLLLDHKVDTPKGQELGETLNRWIQG